MWWGHTPQSLDPPPPSTLGFLRVCVLLFPQQRGKDPGLGLRMAGGPLGPEEVCSLLLPSIYWPSRPCPLVPRGTLLGAPGGSLPPVHAAPTVASPLLCSHKQLASGSRDFNLVNESVKWVVGNQEGLSPRAGLRVGVLPAKGHFAHSCGSEKGTPSSEHLRRLSQQICSVEEVNVTTSCVAPCAPRLCVPGGMRRFQIQARMLCSALCPQVRSAIRKRWHRWQDKHSIRARVARAMSIPTSPTRVSFHSIKQSTAI